jgi:hypothetical protein
VAAVTQLWATAAVTALEAAALPVTLGAGEAAIMGEGTAAVDMGLADFTASAAFVCQLQLEKFARSVAAIYPSNEFNAPRKLRPAAFCDPSRTKLRQIREKPRLYRNCARLDLRAANYRGDLVLGASNLRTFVKLFGAADGNQTTKEIAPCRPASSRPKVSALS